MTVLPLVLCTEHPIAISSHDHLFPRGTACDNTHKPEFVLACERNIQRNPLTYLDLGCAGGGLVADFLARGHTAYGVEGSDYSKLSGRAEWGRYPENLLLADIAQPFEFLYAGKPFCFDVISAFEVLEHLAPVQLPQLFANVVSHLAPDGIFVGSISCLEETDVSLGAVWHQTVMPKEWWRDRFEENGLEFVEPHGFEHSEFARGNGEHGPSRDFRETPSAGFHFVARALS